MLVVKRGTPRAFGDCAVLVRDTVQPAEAEGAPYIGLDISLSNSRT